MKRRRKLLFICLLAIGINSGQSQGLIIGATGNIGLSKVTSNLPVSGDYKVKTALSGNAGIFLEKKISQKSSLGIEALWVQIEGKEVTDDKAVLSADEIGVISDKSLLHSTYVAIPVYYRFEIGKIGIKGGAQPMVFLFANSNNEAKGEINGEPFETKSKTKDIVFDRIDFGPKVGIDYSLNKQLRLRADYYHGIPDITSDEFSWQRRNRQFSLGASYMFGNGE